MPKLEKLKEKIRERGTNYKALAKALGISASAFNNKVNGRSAFDIIEVSKLSSILDISPQEITIFFT